MPLIIKAINKDRYLIEGYNNIGTYYAYKGDYKKAKDYFLKALKYRENYGKALLNLAMVYYYEGNYEKSINYLKRLILINDKDFDKLVSKIFYNLNDSAYLTNLKAELLKIENKDSKLLKKTLYYIDLVLKFNKEKERNG